MVDSPVSTIDLNVYGGPTEIDLNVDFGAKGDRGSKIFAIYNNPTLLTTFTNPDNLPDQQTLSSSRVGDLALNVRSSAPDYLRLYEKTSTENNGWVRVVDLFANIFNDKRNLTFLAGLATTTITLNDIFVVTDYSELKFSVQAQLEAGLTNYPVALVTNLEVAPSGENQILTISIYASELNPTAGSGGTPAWVAVTGSRLVNLQVSAV